MNVHTKSLAVVLMLAAAARGGMVLELVPDRPGPYQPASSVDVEVFLHNNEGETIQPR